MIPLVASEEMRLFVNQVVLLVELQLVVPLLLMEGGRIFSLALLQNHCQDQFRVHMEADWTGGFLDQTYLQ